MNDFADECSRRDLVVLEPILYAVGECIEEGLPSVDTGDALQHITRIF